MSLQSEDRSGVDSCCFISRLSTNSTIFSLCLSLLPSTNGAWYFWVWNLSGVLGKNHLLFITLHWWIIPHNTKMPVCLSWSALGISSVCSYHLALRYWLTSKHWSSHFLHSAGSCRKKCFDSSFRGLESCRCDTECQHRGDCCWDFEDTCVASSTDSEDKFIVTCSLRYR